MKKYIGCDLGGTTLRAAIVDVETGAILHQMSVPTLARQGHDAYEKAGFYVGIAAVNICVAIGPRRIVIGGGVSQAGELLLDPIRRTLRERVTVMPIEQVEVVQSHLADNAGVVGVACWAANQL